jgi:hypothetical protein
VAREKFPVSAISPLALSATLACPAGATTLDSGPVATICVADANGEFAAGAERSTAPP